MRAMHVTPAQIRHALRRLAGTPMLSLGALLILALGIGSAVVMIDVLDRLLLRAPANVTDPDRVARVYLGTGRSFGELADHGAFDAIGGLHDELEASAAYMIESLSLGRGTAARRIHTVAHTPGYFLVLGARPAVGAWPEVNDVTGEDAAVISHALWQQAFGGARDVIGKPLQLGLDTYRIVAVAARGFHGIDWEPEDVWLPLTRRATAGYGNGWKGSVGVRIVVRLRPGVSRERANEHATAVLRAARRSWGQNASVVLGDLRPGRAPGEALGTRVEVLVAGMSIVVLLVACGNVANLMLVRGLRREREFLVKTALGASRMRLLREVLLEALLLAAGAGLVALGVVVSGGSLMRRLFLTSTTALASPIDTRVVLLTGIICLIAAFLLGLAPAVRLTRRRVLSPGHSAMVRPSWILDLFSAMQIALSVPMIVAAGLFVLSFWHARRQDLGMQTDRVAVVTTNLFEAGRPLENHATHRQIQARIARLPGVESTAVIQSLPMESGVFRMIDVPGTEARTGPFSSDSIPLVNSVDPSFFSVMRMRPVDGRLFTDSDNRVGSPPVAVITESMARNYWPNARAVGKCFYMNGRGGSCTEVVGVVRDARLFLSARPTNRWASACYLPIEQTSGLSSRAVLVRMTSDPDEALSMLRREAQTAVPALPYVDVHSFDEPFRNVLMPWRVGSTVFVVFGALSMIVASVGLAVVGAYAITRRTREIGIRAALGAAPRQLVHLVLRRSLMVVATGIAVGMVLAWAAGRILSAQLFDVTAGDARVFSGTALALLIVGGVAAWLPARHAARIDPAITLRAE